jgi:hypothetical protein
MKLKPLFTIIVFALIGCVVHKILASFLIPKSFEENFVYSIPLLYAGFAGFSLLLLFILIKIKANNIDNVGYSFLFLTSLKMMLAYLFLRPILEAASAKTPTEKMNYFIIFIYFLAIETIVTIRILNNKQ